MSKLSSLKKQAQKMAIIETKNLTYTYPGATKPSIVDVSIKVEKGEFVLITGPSGCGKTTLCRCFNGLSPTFLSRGIERRNFCCRRRHA